MSLRQRIFVLVGLAVGASVAIGGGALMALHHTQGQLGAMYAASLRPIVIVNDIRSRFNSTRTGLNRALLGATLEAAQKEQADNAQAVAKMNQLWDAYDPAMVSSPEEREDADRFLAARSHARQLKHDLESMMLAGRHDEAVAFMLNTVGPAFNDESKAIDAIVEDKVAKAAEAYAETERVQQHTFVGVLAAIGAVALGLLVAGALLARAILQPLLAAREISAKISTGVLGHSYTVTGRDEVSETLRALLAMDQALVHVVDQVRHGAQEVAHAAHEISQGNDELSTRTQQQAASLEETAASMEQMTASVQQSAQNAEHACALTQSLLQGSTDTRAVAEAARVAMDRADEASQKIAVIMGLMDEMTFQTHLLSLNAAVEAARVGVQGRGFAVIAQEVRALSERSAHAAKDIKDLIQDGGARVKESLALVRQTDEALRTMEHDVQKVAHCVDQMALAATEQAHGIAQVNQAVGELDGVTQQNAALVEEASAASHHASQMADDLRNQVAFFHLDAPSALPSPAAAHEQAEYPAQVGALA